MKKLLFFTTIIISIWVNFNLNSNYAWAKKIINQVKLTRLDNLNDSSLEVFLNDSDLIQNISTKNAELNLSFDASSLIKDTLLPTSFKIEIYDITSNKRLLGIVRPSILDERPVRNFKINIELVNLTKSSNLEIDIYNTKNKFFANYHASIVIENQSEISFTELEAADCTGQFGKCQLEYIFQNIHFTTLPSKGLKTKVEQNIDGSYSVNLPLIRGKKYIRVKNIFGGSNGDSGSSDNQDFSFDFDGSNLFVIKDGVTTQVAAQGPVGAKGETGATGPKGDDGAPGSFSGGEINGTLSFTANGKLQDAILNGTSLVITNNAGEIPLIVKGATAQTANLQEWQNSTGTSLASISADGNLRAASGTFSNDLTTNGLASSVLKTTTATGSVESGIWSASATNLLRSGNNIGGLIGTSSAHGIDFVTNGYTRMTISAAGIISLLGNFSLGTSTSGNVFYQNAPSGWGDSYIVQRAGTSRGGIGGLSGDDGVALFSGVNYTSGTPAVRVSTNRVDIVNAPVIISGQGAAATGLTVRGAAAQTANLQEWQNSASSALAYFTSAGQLIIPNAGSTGSGTCIGGTDSRGVLTVQKNGLGTYSPNADPGDQGRPFVMQENSNTNTANQFSNISLQINAGGALSGGRCLADMRLVRETINQSNSYFLWSGFTQPSTYTDWAAIGRNYAWFIGSVNVGSQASTSAQFQSTAGSSSTVGAVIKGATSQTANLQEWQNGAGAVVASMSASGVSTASYFRTPNKASGVSLVAFRIYDEYGAIHGIGLDPNNQLYTTGSLGVNGSAPGGHKLSVTGITSINLSGADYFGVGNSGDGYAALKVVGTTNYVGIGTQSPTERLEVQGNVKINGGLTSSQDIEITDPTRGIILRSPNGTRWRIQVTDAGALTTTSL